MSAFTEMRLCSLLQKPRLGAGAMPASTVVRMATIEGARALGIGSQCGSLEPGKKADITVVDTSGPHMRPRSDPFNMLVYAAEAGDVKHVFVDGEWLVRDKALVRWELDEVTADAEKAIDEILERSGGAKRA